MSELYTASRLRAFRSCPRAHFYRYGLGIRTPSSPAMAFGTHTHSALEAYFRQWQRGGDRVGNAFAEIDILDCEEVDRIKLRALIAAYHARWGAEDWEILEVEKEFRYWLGDVEIGGKIDAIIRDRATDRAFVLEHKTSTADTSPGAPYWSRLSIDTQISVYLDAGHALDLDFAGCIYDVIKRPMHEPKLATPPDKQKFTIGKGCKLCGGNLQGLAGSGKSTATQSGDCAVCKGTGWRIDADGVPEAPRLHATQRATDETIEEYAERLTAEIAGRVDEYLSRGVIVRLDSELPRMRQELLDTIASMQMLGELAPPNHDACVRGREFCPFFIACSGQADIADQHVFPRGDVHPELNNSAA